MKFVRRLTRHAILKPETPLGAGVGFVVLAASLLITACGTPNAVPQLPDSSEAGIIVLGAVVKTGLKVPVDTARMSVDLAALLAGRGDIPVTSTQTARKIVGAGPHDEMLSFYARHSRFAPYQIQRLMAANLPFSKALMVRLVSDQVEQLPLQREVVLDEKGRQIADRERRTFVTQRVTRLAAMLVDLRNGRVLWTRQYRVNPTAQIAVTHRLGDSLTTSLAATVANTVVQGFGNARYPEPPALHDSVLALLQEVAYQVPLD